MPKEDDRESRVTLIAAIIIAAKCAMGSPGSHAPAVATNEAKPAQTSTTPASAAPPRSRQP